MNPPLRGRIFLILVTKMANSKSLLACSRAPGEVEGTQTNYTYNSMDQVTERS